MTFNTKDESSFSKPLISILSTKTKLLFPLMILFLLLLFLVGTSLIISSTLLWVASSPIFTSSSDLEKSNGKYLSVEGSIRILALFLPL